MRFVVRFGGVIVVIVLLIAYAGADGKGPMSFLHSAGGDAGLIGPGGRTTTREPGGTTARRTYDPGDCVTWDQSGGVESLSTAVVPCTRSHLFEISGRVDLSGRFDHFPTEAEWEIVYRHDCRRSVEALLGGPLDPWGRFLPAGLRPALTSWEHGDRIVWCGARSAGDRPPAPGQPIASFTGKVEGAPQSWLQAAGTCQLAAAPYPVPCSQPHEFEVAGHIDLTGVVATPPAPEDATGWNRLIGSKCDNVARAFLGHDLAGNEFATAEPIMAESWAAGRRVVECSVARAGADGHAETRTGSLRA